MVARALNLSGLYLGPDDAVSISAPDNPEGFWENIHFVRLNDELLALHGGAWDLPPDFAKDWAQSAGILPFRAKAASLLEQFSQQQQWGWKDPRNSLTLEFWRELLPGLKVVICLRNPLEIVQSLARRGYSSPVFGFQLWMAYNQGFLDAIPAENRIVSHYDSFFSDPRSELSRLLSFLGLTPAEEQMAAALASVKLPLRHNRASINDLLDFSPPYELIRLYGDLCFQAGPVFQALNGRNPAVLQVKAGEYRKFLEGHKKMRIAERLADKEQAVLHLLSEKEKLTQVLSAAEADRSALRARLEAGQADLQAAQAEKEATIQALLAEKEILTQGLRTLEGDRADLRTRLEAAQTGLRAAQAEKEATIQALLAEKEMLTQGLRTLEGDRADLRTRLEAAQAGLQAMEAEKESKLQALLAEKETLTQGVRTLEGDRADLRTRLEAAQAGLQAMEAEKEFKLQALLAEKETLTQGVRTLEGDRGSLCARLEAAQAGLQAVQAEKEATIQALLAEKETLTQGLRTLEGERAELRTRLEAAQTGLQAVQAEKEAKLQALLVEKETLTQGLRALEADRLDLRTRLEAAQTGLQAEQAEKEATIQALLAEKETLTQGLRTLEADRLDLRTRLETAQTGFQALRAEDERTLEALLTEEETLGQRLGTLEADRADLRIRLETAQADVRGTQAEKERLTEELRALEAVRTDLRSRLEATEEDLHASQAEKATLAEELRTLEADRIDLRAGLAAAQADLQAIQVEKEQAVQALCAESEHSAHDLEALEVDRSALRVLIEKLQEDRRRLQNDAEKLQESLRASETGRARLQSQLKHSQATVGDKEETLRKLRTERDRLDRQLAEIDSARGALEAQLLQLGGDRDRRDDALRDLGLHAEQLRRALAESETDRASLKNQLLSAHVYIRGKEHDARAAVSYIEELHRSNEFKAMCRYYAALEKIAPSGSLLRWCYRAPARVYGRLARSLAPRPGAGAPSPGQSPDVAAVPRVHDGKRQGVCTIASKNYLSLARVFAESVTRANPEVAVFVLLVDEVEDRFDPRAEPFRLITAGELDNIPHPRSFFFKYDPIELNTAIKPYFLEYLFREFSLDKICFFDPDIYVFSRLDCLWALLDTQCLVLTPHITSPYRDHCRPTEIDLNLAGVYNLGFLGLSRTPATADFLQWWKERLYDYCYMKPAEGMHVDQNWMHFAPAMQERVFILRDPAYNIAYWNLHERGHRLKFESERLYVDHRPAVFYHFSGFSPNNLEIISKHQNRYQLEDFPNLRPLFAFYRDRVNRKGYETIKQWPYAFGRLTDGSKVPMVARGMYSRLSRERMLELGDPFAAGGPGSFVAWLNEPVDHADAAPSSVITRLHMEIYQLRGDVRKVYPEPLGADREGFAGWLRSSAVKEHGLDPVFFPDGPGAVPSRPSGGGGRSTFSARDGLRQLLKEAVLRVVPHNSRLFYRLIRWDARYLKRKTVPPALPAGSEPVGPLPFGANVAGYIQGEFGVAEVARATLKALISSGVPHVLNNVVTTYHRNQDATFDAFSTANPYRVNLVHVNADQVPAFVREKGPQYFKGRYNIGHWSWELERFPQCWSSSFAPFQEIWVPSVFCQESIAKVSPVPVLRMPFSVLINEQDAQPDRPRFALPADKFLFGFLFDFLSFAERKNPLGLLQAFRQAFSRRADVLLVVKCINSQYAADKAAALRQAAEGCPVHFIDGHLPRREMAALMATFDCYVSLHRSEGFGIGLAQSMYLGKPVIATGYSGNMEYMNHNNSFPIAYRLVELAENYGPYEKGNVWAEPDVEHAAELMRKVVDDRALRERVSRRAAADLRRQLAPEVAGAAIRDRLRLVAGG